MSSAREMSKDQSRPTRWEGAPRGMIKNAPQDDLPEGAVAKVTNAICYPVEWRPRAGTVIRECPEPPALAGRTGYEAYKTGNRIVASEDVFSQADVSNWWVWPDVNGKRQHDEIQQYVGPREVRTGTSNDIALTSGCWMHGRCNLWEFHSTMSKFVFQWGEDVYTAELDDNNNIVNRQLCICRSVDKPANVDSTWDEDERMGVIFSPSRGMFAIDLETNEYWRRNTSVPQVFVDANLRTKDRIHRYPYTYAMAKIKGHGLRNRTTIGAAILQQSGSIKVQPAEKTEIDYTDRWTQKPIGDGTFTTGRLVGKPIDERYRDPYWYASQPAPGVSLQLTVNDIKAEFVVDMSPAGYDVNSMGAVAEALQTEFRTVFPFVTVAFDEDHWDIAAGNVHGSTIGYLEAGTSGTDISEIMELREGDNPSLDNSYQYQSDHEVGVVSVPYQEYASGQQKTTRERHWTHYVLIRGPDQGLYGVKPRVDEISGAILSPVDMGWVLDARVAGAFFASKDEDGLITAYYGEFERKDEGTPFEWEDGEVDTLGVYVDSKHMYARGGGYYYEQTKEPMAAAIGGGRVIRGYQTGDRVYRTGFGDNFASLTVGETLWASDLRELVVVAIISDTEVQVNQKQDRPTQGFTCCPTQRVINDTVSDEALLNRAGERVVGLWEYRWYAPMATAGLGCIVPAMVVTARQNGSLVYYCGLGVYTRYMMGYHLPNRQICDRIKGSIQAIKKTANKVVVFCKDQTWVGPTNVSDSNIKKIADLGTSYVVLYLDIASGRIGVVDTGSIGAIADGVFEMRCQDGSWRQFNGATYSDDYTMDPDTRQDRIKSDLGDTWPQSAGIYSDKESLGHILWGKAKE